MRENGGEEKEHSIWTYIWIIGIAALVCYIMFDYQIVGTSYFASYFELDSQLVSSSKQDFLVRYQDTVVGTASAANAVSKEPICISTEIFSETSVRLNTEIYEEAAVIADSEFLQAYFGEVTTNIAQSAKEFVTPLMFVCLAGSETGTWSDRKFTWVPAIYSKGIADQLESIGGSWDEVSISDVGSDFYVELGLTDYFHCGQNCDLKDSSSMHFAYEVGRKSNDNDSLGPLQILRRYVSVTVSGGNPWDTEYYIDITGNDGSIIYTVTDLMSWKDNVMWAFDHAMQKIRTKCVGAPFSDWQISNEYELMCLISVAHNTGASYLSDTTSSAGSFWSSKEAVYQFCQALTTPQAVAYIMQNYVEPWYEQNLERFISDENWNLPGNSLFEGTGNEKDMVMLDILENACGLKITEQEKYDSRYPLNCIYWNRTVAGSDHKFRYPVKSLVNYLALWKLYHSGGET